MIPATTNLYQLNTSANESFNGSTITATRIGVSRHDVVSRPLTRRESRESADSSWHDMQFMCETDRDNCEANGGNKQY